MKPKVLWVYTVNPGVTFYRMYQFLNRMSELDLVHSRIYPEWKPESMTSPTWEKTLSKDAGFWKEMVDWADLVVMQYIYTPEGLSLAMAIKDFKPCICEIDDFLGAIPSYSLAYESYKPGDGQDYYGTRHIMEAMGVVYSTPWLMSKYLKYNPIGKVIPNCIDFRLWEYENRPKNDRIRIGWVGGATHEGDLKLIKPVVYELLDKYPNIEVWICTSPPPKWEKHDRLNLNDVWSTIDKYPAMVKKFNFDIGIAPLRDNMFNRAKSNLRGLEYASMKIPVVTSDVEPFKGWPFVCSGDLEWFDTLCKLIDDEELRVSEGLKIYEYVKTNFNLEDISLSYYSYIKEITDGMAGRSINIVNMDSGREERGRSDRVSC